MKVIHPQRNSFLMKKSILFTVFLSLFMLSTKAQQTPLYSQLYFMRMLYNPALTAYNGSTNLYGFYRDQWTNMPGHPVTAGVLGEISLWKDQIGTGFHVYQDNTDIIHRTDAQAYYAQKIKLAKNHTLSLGFSLGIMETHVDFSNAIATDAGDSHLLSAGKSGAAFDMSVGLAYQWKKLTIGFAVPQVVNTQTTLTNQSNSTTLSNKRQFIGSASYEISINHEKFNIEPSVLVKSGSSLPVQVDGNIMANYKRFLYLGVGYRMEYGVSMTAAVRISKTVTVGYAYEYPIMKNIGYSDTKGTHELIVGINFDKFIKKKDQNKDIDKKIDSLMAKNDSIQKAVDSLVKQVDSLRKDMDTAKMNIDSLKNGSKDLQQQNKELQQENKDQQQKEQELKQNLEKIQTMVKDSFETLAKEYRKHIKDKPAVNFPDAIDKSTKANKGDIYRLNKVEFDRNSSYLKKESYPELDKLISFMNMNPNAHIRVMGHTDYIATDEYNQWLSDRRAKRVYDYLIEKGIAADRMTYIGFGKKVPIADNSTDEGRAKNRRVEVEVVK